MCQVVQSIVSVMMSLNSMSSSTHKINCGNVFLPNKSPPFVFADTNDSVFEYMFENVMSSTSLCKYHRCFLINTSMHVSATFNIKRMSVNFLLISIYYHMMSLLFSG